jgi:TPR repeat protein
MAAIFCLAALGAKAEVDVAVLRSRADQGDAAAANVLGTAYVNGQGVPQDYQAALHYFRLAAEAGYSEAEFNLGQMYELGRGVQADAATAFANYLGAARQGVPLAEFNVANMYAAGRGVPRSDEEAMVWLRQAADSGLPQAQFNLALDYEDGRGVVKDEAKAQSYYRAAAAQGHVRAEYNLALMLEQGRGSDPDLPAAAALYRGAALQGFGPAETNYGVMLAQGRGANSPNLPEGYAWMCLAVENGMPSTARDYFSGRLDASQLEKSRARLALLRAQTPTATEPATGNAQSSSVDAGLRDQIAKMRRELAAARSSQETAERHAANLEAEMQAVLASEGAAEGLQRRIDDLQAANDRLSREVRDMTLRFSQAEALLRRHGEALPEATGGGP